MAVSIKLIGQDEENMPIFEATDLETNELVEVKNWYEKSKDKWHIVLGPNSANRKYLAHNEFNEKNEEGVYHLKDRTTPPRVMGTRQPDRALVPYMTEEDKAEYDRIIASAIENRNKQKAQPLTEEEKLERQIKRLQTRLVKLNEEVEEVEEVEVKLEEE